MAHFSLKHAIAYFAAGAAAALVGTQLAPSQAQLLNQPVAQVPAMAAGTPDANFISAVADQTGPAVVRIDSSRTLKSRSSARPGQVVQGTGSGFIFRNDGMILTNAHVVDGADRVTVTLKDGRDFSGRVLGVDELTDVAVVKIDASNLPTVKLGNSDQLKPGEWAIAIGNPLGLDNSVTAGIISGTGRSSSVIGANDKRVSFIQTDAAINPGNSGGPLLNQRGEVVGINTAIIGGAQGLGFAIPINQAQRIATQLVSQGQASHPYLGIQMADLTPARRDALNQEANLNLTTDHGVLIMETLGNSPAAKAGLQRGDIIQAINGRPVKTGDEVQQLIENSTIGSNLSVEVLRGGQTVTVGVRPEQAPVS